MKKIIACMILCIISFNSFAVDIPDSPNYDKDLNIDMSNIAIGKAQETLNHPNARNTNNYDTRDIQNNFNKWMSNPSNFKAIMGDKNEKLSTVGSGQSVEINMSCTASQNKFAELNISDGTNISMVLKILEPSQTVTVKHINGICNNKFTICNEDENEAICKKIFKYTNYSNEGKRIGNDNSTDIQEKSEQEVIKSHPCYKVTKCMSWNLSLDNDTVVIKNAAGANCISIKDTGITVSEKDALIEQVKALLSDLSVNGLSDTVSGNLNSKTEYYELSNTCNNNSYGSGSTNIKDLSNIYNNPMSQKDKDKLVANEKNNENSILHKLDNSSKNNSYTLDKDIINNLNQSINSSNMDNISKNISIQQQCYNPICTVDITETVIRTKTDGSKVEETKYERVFRDCTASSYKEVNGIKETVYQCPVNNTTEKAIAQDNGAICTCDNKHEQVENLKNVLMATAMADAIRKSACGENDDEDNETLSNLQERRNECKDKKDAEYDACMNRPF